MKLDFDFILFLIFASFKIASFLNNFWFSFLKPNSLFLHRCIDEILRISCEGNEKRTDGNVIYMDLGRNKWNPGRADTDSQLVMSVNALAARFEFHSLALNFLMVLS